MYTEVSKMDGSWWVPGFTMLEGKVIDKQVEKVILNYSRLQEYELILMYLYI